MQGYIDLKNKQALEYNRSINEELNEICLPLLKFGIVYFCYVKFFNDGKRLYLFNEPWWVELYLKNNFQDNIDHLEHYAPQKTIRYSFWTSVKNDAVFDALHEADIWYGFSIYEKHDKYVESFEFSTLKENYQIENFYFNNINILEDFIKYFKKKAAHLIDQENKNGLIIPKQKIIADEILHTAYMEKDKIEKFKREIGIRLDEPIIKNEMMLHKVQDLEQIEYRNNTGLIPPIHNHIVKT